MTKLWALFSDRLEDVLSSVWFHFQVSPAADNQPGPANAVLNPCRYSTQRRHLHKNRLHLVKTSCPFGTRKAPGSTFRERKLAHAVGRLAEMVKLEQHNLTHSRG